MGLALEWDEEPYEWMWPAFLSVRRRYSRGPMRDVRIGWKLEAEGDGTKLTVTVDTEPRSWFHAALGALPMRRMFSRMFEAVAAFDSHLAGEAPSPYPTRFARTEVNRPGLDSATRRLETSVDSRHVKLLARLVEEEVPERVATLRPFEQADAWGMDRLDALRMYLHATRAGMLSLKWSVICPRCHGVKARHDSLKQVAARQACESCALAFDVDLDRRVEATFAPHASIRQIEPATFCFGGPMNTPHILGQFHLGPRESRRIDLSLPAGDYRLQWDGREQGLDLTVGSGPESLEVDLASKSTDPLAVGKTLTLRNPLDEPIRAALERPDSGRPRATAAKVLALAEFRGLFDAEVLADGVELSVGSIAVLFSDLKGSTEMYEKVGDAPAWGRVRRHFDFMTGHIAAHRGAIVKTMGDAVMAVFPDPADAVACAVAIQREAPPAEGAIKLGVHFGPCLAVTADGRLDYFGSTVNLAQRTQSQSKGGDVVVSDVVRRLPGMDEALRRLGTESSPFTAALKGIDGMMTLHRLAISPPPGGPATR